jgi:hypothetical protein
MVEKMKKVKQATVVIFSLFFFSGCSVYMAANQPSAKNVDLFKVGTPRGLLLAEFGLPIVAEVRDEKKYEIYKFTEGYSNGAKAGRAMLHGVGDVLTLGLWEVVATPTEIAFDGDEIAFQVRYSETDLIDEVVALKSKK